MNFYIYKYNKYKFLSYNIKYMNFYIYKYNIKGYWPRKNFFFEMLNK